MALTIPELADAVSEMTEGRFKALTISLWAKLEIQKIIQKKRFWWRRKYFTLSTVAGTSRYDLSSLGLNTAPDFEQAIKVYVVSATQLLTNPQSPGLVFLDDPVSIAAAINDQVSQGPPSGYFITPGTTKTLQISPVPNAVYPLFCLYWAGYSPAADDTEQAIVLIPESHHYVVLDALIARVFFYLYGQEDDRYREAKSQFDVSMADLMGFQAGSQEAVHEWRTSDYSVIVTSTS